jgi:hypothetical protein
MRAILMKFNLMNNRRYQTGRRTRPGACFMLELKADAISPFQYLQSWNNVSTTYQRYSNVTPHEWLSEKPEPWNARILEEMGYTKPWEYAMDRQVALAELRNVTQGSYKCANNGKCVAPDTCACSKGWIGFDCRVPVCEQGYYESNQHAFVKGINDKHELAKFKRFLSENHTYLLNPADEGYSNPTYVAPYERFINHSFVEKKKATLGGVLYVQLDENVQGGYECSIRSVTEWEDYRSGTIIEHPNYYSRYMDRKIEADGNVYTDWEDMGWEPTFQKTAMFEMSEKALGIDSDPQKIFVYTDKGYMRRGYWQRTNSSWSKGYCIIEFRRVCEDQKKAQDLEASDENSQKDFLVQDTDLVSSNS